MHIWKSHCSSLTPLYTYTSSVSSLKIHQNIHSKSHTVYVQYTVHTVCTYNKKHTFVSKFTSHSLKILTIAVNALKLL
jgi:hypothetical protein